MNKYIFKMRQNVRKLFYLTFGVFVYYWTLLKIWLFKPYYLRLKRHAEDMYRSSQIFEDLRSAFGVQYALDDFHKKTNCCTFILGH